MGEHTKNEATETEIVGVNETVIVEANMKMVWFLPFLDWPFCCVCVYLCAAFPCTVVIVDPIRSDRIGLDRIGSYSVVNFK